MFSIIVKQGIRNSSFWRIWSFVLILKTNRLKLSNYKFVHHKRTLNLESVNSSEAQTFVQVVQNAARWMVNISTVIVAAVRINKRWKTLDPITRFCLSSSVPAYRSPTLRSSRRGIQQPMWISSIDTFDEDGKCGIDASVEEKNSEIRSTSNRR